MTSRLNHDLIQWIGSSSKGKEMPDFLTSDDPWFRPVDVQWGPDGAMYVAKAASRGVGVWDPERAAEWRQAARQLWEQDGRLPEQRGAGMVAQH